MALGFKSCSKCLNTYPACFGHFYRQKATSDGYTSWCRLCDREKSRIAKRMARLEGRIKSPTPEKSREYFLKWRSKNLEKARSISRASQKKRRLDPSYRAMSNIGRRIRDMINGRQGSTRLLPYNAKDLVEHIERQSSKGMTWENYGREWHIDHIVPLSSFEFHDENSEGFKACWALSNLRPMWAFDNMSKGAKKTNLI